MPKSESYGVTRPRDPASTLGYHPVKGGATRITYEADGTRYDLVAYRDPAGGYIIVIWSDVNWCGRADVDRAGFIAQLSGRRVTPVDLRNIDDALDWVIRRDDSLDEPPSPPVVMPHPSDPVDPST